MAEAGPEQEWTVTARDGKVIYGITTFSAKKMDKAIVLVHGMLGHYNEYHLKVASIIFSQLGYDVLRFNLYGGDKGRLFQDCTLQTHAQDLNNVLTRKTHGYKHVFAAGHSYGGPTIMIAQPANEYSTQGGR
jgi:alpha-beta hydrolase superfamily lysophospholipase